MWQCRKYVAPPPPPPQKRKVNAPIIKQIVYATSSEEEIVTESRSHLESRELQLDEEVVIRKKATGETVRKQALGASLQSKLHDSVKEHYERGADHVASYQDSVHGTKIVKKSTSPKP